MNLKDIETKEHLIKDFFIWLFDDNRITNKDIILKNEIDLTLVSSYFDPNIYYPKQFADFFNTKAMKRLGRISQLDLAIDDFPNLYHNRLEHSKGVYYRKLEEMLYNFLDKKWRNYIETNNMKLYLLGELLKMAGHDIGHLPLSHALEVQIFSKRGTHELIGKRIMLEDSEIQSVLNSISPELPNILKQLYDKPILNFQEHDESNYDVDRFDYIIRDNLYAGNNINLPYSQYQTVHIDLDESGLPKHNPDGSILTNNLSNFTIDIYDYSSLHDIENLLEVRTNGYKNIYCSPKTHIRERCIKALLSTFLASNSETGKDLRNYINKLKVSNISDLDLSLFLDWDDIKFYDQILEIAEKHENENIRLLATMTIPNMKAFLTMLYSHLEIYAKTKNYSFEDKKFLQKIKSLIRSNSVLSHNLKSTDFVSNNTLVFNSDQNLPEVYDNYINNDLIYCSKIKIKAYNPKEPIYIRSVDGKIYELSQHPNRKYDWDTKISYIKNVYAYVPYLRLHGISESEIQEMHTYCNTSLINSTSKKCDINMQPLQTNHKIEDCFLEL